MGEENMPFSAIDVRFDMTHFWLFVDFCAKVVDAPSNEGFLLLRGTED